jgi:hypothetical protein
MKASGAVDIKIHIFLTWALSCQLQARPLFHREGAPRTHWIGDWVDPRAGLDELEKRKFFTLPGPELRPVCCPARSQSLYRLSCLVHEYLSFMAHSKGKLHMSICLSACNKPGTAQHIF